MLSPAMMKSMGRRTSTKDAANGQQQSGRDSKGSILPSVEEEDPGANYHGRRRVSNHSLLGFEDDFQGAELFLGINGKNSASGAMMLRGVNEQEQSRMNGRRASLAVVSTSTKEKERRASTRGDRERRTSISAAGAKTLDPTQRTMISKRSPFFGNASVLQQASIMQKEELKVHRSQKKRASRASEKGEHIEDLVKALHSSEKFTNLHKEQDLRVNILPHQYTSDPTVAWEMLKAKRPVKRVIQMKLDTPIRPDHVRFVCISCTHGLPLPTNIPAGDVLIVAGDFTSCGLPKEVKNFNSLLGSSRHAYKVIIAGNHECTFDENFLKSNNREIGEAKELALKQALLSSLAAAKLNSPKPLLTNAVYLQDQAIELFGITIYGTPWQPRVDNWAFNLPRGAPLLEKWNGIPAGVDVLITHTPPLGHGDLMANGQRMGCVELLNSVVKRIKPKYHVFGHIHEGYGCTSDGYTKFINCCLTDSNMELKNGPVIFDIQVHPTTKQYYLNNIKKITKRLTKDKEKK